MQNMHLIIWPSMISSPFFDNYTPKDTDFQPLWRKLKEVSPTYWNYWSSSNSPCLKSVKHSIHTWGEQLFRRLNSKQAQDVANGFGNSAKLTRKATREREREVDYSFQASKKANYHEWKEKVLQARNRNWPINTHERLFTKLLLPICPKKVGFSEIVEGNIQHNS